MTSIYKSVGKVLSLVFLSAVLLGVLFLAKQRQFFGSSASDPGARCGEIKTERVCRSVEANSKICHWQVAKDGHGGLCISNGVGPAGSNTPRSSPGAGNICQQITTESSCKDRASDNCKWRNGSCVKFVANESSAGAGGTLPDCGQSHQCELANGGHALTGGTKRCQSGGVEFVCCTGDLHYYCNYHCDSTPQGSCP